MTTGARVYKQTVQQKGGGVVIARVNGAAGVPLVQADFGTINAAAFNWTTDDPIGSVIPLTPETVILDALVTGDVRWKQDSDGYNFLWSVPAVMFPAGIARVRLEIVFSPTASENIVLVYDLKALKTLS